MDVLIGWPGGDWQSTAWIVGGVVGGYLALIWVTTVLWTYRDIRSRTRDPFAQIVAVVLALIPFAGLPLYVALRPSETLADVWDRRIEQEALLSELYSVAACPQCRRPVQDEFIHCPHCQTSLKAPCANCGRLMTHLWRHCPFCGTTREPALSAERLEFDAAASLEAPSENGAAAADATEPAGRPQPDFQPEPAPERTRSRRSPSEESASP